MKRLIRPNNILGYASVIAVLAIDAVLVYTSLATIARSNVDVDRSRQVIADLERVMTILKDAETGQRGYLLTGRDVYLEPFRSATAEFDRVAERLRASSVDGGRRPIVDDLLLQAGRRMGELDTTVRLRRDEGLAAAMAIVETDIGRESMKRAARLADRLREAEGRLLEDRLGRSRSAVRHAVITFSITTLTAILLGVGLFLLQYRNLKARDRAEAEIREGAAWLSTTLVSIGDALIATDDRGHVRFMNPVAQSLTGWSEAEARGRPMAQVFRIINEVTRLPVESPVDKVLSQGSIVGLANHTTLIARDGTETSIDDSAAPIKDARGRISGVVLVFRDITERRRQEAALAEGRRLAEFGRDIGLALSEAAGLAEMLRRCAEVTVRDLNGAFARIWTVDETGQTLVLAASAGLYTHLDGPHARVPVGKYKIGLIAEERKPHLTNDVVGDLRVSDPHWAAREGMVGFAGYPLLVDDQLIGVWAMFSRKPLSEATLAAMESVARGIALGIERKRTLDALASSEGRKAAIFQNALDAIITIDHEGRVVEFNPAAVRLFGHPIARAIGRPLDSLIIPPALREAHRRGLARYLATGEGPVIGRRIELTALRADGEEFPVELAIMRITTDGPPLFTAHIRDISERKQAEARLEFQAKAGIGLAESLDYAETTARVAKLGASIFGHSCILDLLTEDGERVERVAWARRTERT